MSCEHGSGCGHNQLPPIIEIEHDHHHDHAQHVGRLCVAGCSNPSHNHSGLPNQLQAIAEQFKFDDDDDEVVDPVTGKKVKRRDLRRREVAA